VTAGPIGIFGGTFNPIHFGHLRSALELREVLGLEQIRLMPSARPPHRNEPDCSAQMRAQLVELAVADEPGLICDTRELDREGPSYTYDSLLQLRKEVGQDVSLCLIMGADAVAGFDSWHRWQDILELAHVVVMARPGWRLPREGQVAHWMQQHLTTRGATLQHKPCGTILVQQLRPLDISATEIRHLVAAGKSPRYLIPDVVWARIREAGLYGFKGITREQNAV
jgi:nicotinate-nucleotide adenylyltransferase